jgi:hypothetical protein
MSFLDNLFGRKKEVKFYINLPKGNPLNKKYLSFNVHEEAEGWLKNNRSQFKVEPRILRGEFDSDGKLVTRRLSA